MKFLRLFLIIFTMYSLPAKAVVQGDTTGQIGSNIIWDYISNTGLLNLYGEGEIGNIDEYGSNQPWVSFRHEIKEVRIGEGITKVNDYAFFDLLSLSSISLPKSLTYIGSHAFKLGLNVTELIIPENVSYIGQYAFDGMTKLETVIALSNNVATIHKFAFGGIYTNSVNLVVLKELINTYKTTEGWNSFTNIGAFPEYLSINKDSHEIMVGVTKQLSFTLLPQDVIDKTITWKTSNKSVLSVNSTGLIQGVSTGNAVITATTKYGNFTDTLNIVVKPFTGTPDLLEVKFALKRNTNNINDTLPEIHTVQVTPEFSDNVDEYYVTLPVDASYMYINVQPSYKYLPNLYTFQDIKIIPYQQDSNNKIGIYLEETNRLITLNYRLGLQTEIKKVGHDIKIYSKDDVLYINTPSNETVKVYNLQGKLLSSAYKQTGETRIQLTQKGVFVVRGGSGWSIKIIK